MIAAMEPQGAGPRCSNQVYVCIEGETPEPTQVCSCSAGLVHMLDCPVDMGLACAFFRELAGAPAVVDPGVADDLHTRLMNDYLSRTYYHRVRGLAPAGDPWHRRREELYAFYATVELEGAEAADDEEGYERERERLLVQRQKREEARKAREALTREERAKERARLGIKTVVEKAQEAVALQGNVRESMVDDLQLPAPEAARKRRRRRGRRRPGEDGGGAEAAGREQMERPETAAGGEAGAEPAPGGGPRRRRRRRRRSGGKGGSPPPSA